MVFYYITALGRTRQAAPGKKMFQRVSFVCTLSTPWCPIFIILPVQNATIHLIVKQNNNCEFNNTNKVYEKSMNGDYPFSPGGLSQAGPDGNCTTQSTNYHRRRQPATVFTYTEEGNHSRCMVVSKHLRRRSRGK